MTAAVSSAGKIHVLPGEVVSRIAAGEVIERPAAVVKELIENSLDAGSTSVAVDVKDGGLGLIRVTDDGEGMSRIDAPRALQRHATSKLGSDQDLSSIHTMGFRGEALPSIASVSKIRLLTFVRRESAGTELLVTAGGVTTIKEAAAVPGTRIEVTDLFFNTPARKKFLKSTTTEFSHIAQVVQQASLAWPSTQFRLTHNGHEVVNFPAVSVDRDRILQVYRPNFLERSLEVSGARSGVRLRGFAIDAVHARASKIPQDLFVNRRPVRNAMVFHAVADSYGGFLAKGHHPAFVLFLEVDPDRVDVNVHPAKREIRFVDQEGVHQTVRQAVRQALGDGQRKTQIQTLGQGASVQDILGAAPSNTREDDPRHRGNVPAGLRHIGVGSPDYVAAIQAPSQFSFVQEPLQTYLPASQVDVIPFGQLDRTFVVAQVGSELQVVDQHTAHERVLFERLWRTWREQEVQSQPLLLPEPIELAPHKAMLLERHLDDLGKLGLVIEPFGHAAFLVRALPALLKHFDSMACVLDLLDELSHGDRASSFEARMRPVVASLACHGAVRAGRAMALPEMQQLVEDWVQEGMVMTCPHGRRVALRLPADELAKMFGRT
ncbi:MAG: DNA mismatch repair endonuclease MutL [Nitrospiraceae bacterium]